MLCSIAGKLAMPHMAHPLAVPPRTPVAILSLLFALGFFATLLMLTGPGEPLERDHRRLPQTPARTPKGFKSSQSSTRGQVDRRNGVTV